MNHKTVLIEVGNIINPQDTHVIEDIQSAIRGTGCSIGFDEIDGEKYIYLSINYDTAKNSRGAGRRKKPVAYEHMSIRCGEVREMVKHEGVEATAEKLGVSRATLFRRIKDKADDRYF